MSAFFLGSLLLFLAVQSIQSQQQPWAGFDYSTDKLSPEVNQLNSNLIASDHSLAVFERPSSKVLNSPQYRALLMKFLKQYPDSRVIEKGSNAELVSMSIFINSFTDTCVYKV